MKRKLENPNPSETEKLLFKYSGLYLIESTECILRYAPVHTEGHNAYPSVIEDIDDDSIEYDNAITFVLENESICFGNINSNIKEYYDADIMFLLLQRMTELGFKQTFTKTRTKESIGIVESPKTNEKK